MIHSGRNRSKCWTVWGMLLLLVAVSGCASQYFAETRLNSDGSIERAIWQPRQNAADVESQVGAWSRIVPVHEVARTERPVDIRHLSDTHQHEKGVALAAWGMFSSVSDIPAHTLFATPNGKQAGTLERRYSRRDLVFVAEHTWEEVLHDIVTLRGMRQACQQLVASLEADSEALLDSRWGDEYDVSQLVDWIGTSGRDWLGESVELLYDTMARRPENMNQVLAEAFADISANYGLTLRHPDGRLFGSDEEENGSERTRQAWNQFLIHLLNERLVRHDGRLHDEITLQQMAQEVTAVLLGTSATEPELPPPMDATSWHLWQEALSSVIVSRYGTQEACQQHYVDLTTQVVGVYLLPFTSNNAQFEYFMTMPGTVVETSGKLVSENRVEWKFQASDAFPLGYAMKVRSLEPMEEHQRKLLGRMFLNSRAAVLEYAGLLDRQPALQLTLEMCLEQGSMEPLREHRRRLLAQRPQPPGTAQALLEELTQLEQLMGLAIHQVK